MPFEFSEIVLQAKNVLSQNQPTQIQVGYIDENGFLFNITASGDLTIQVVQGVATISTISGGLYILPYSLGTLILKLTYQNIYNYISLWVIPGVSYPQVNDLIAVTYRYLYPNCYTADPTSTAYTKNFGTSTVFASIYSFIYSNFLNIYPPFTDNTAWESELNDGPPWTGSTHYPLVIQESNNLSTFNANLFNITYLITEYIYARTGNSFFVYVQETYTNPQNSWVLGYSRLGINTILAEPSTLNSVIVNIETNILPPTGFETELIAFIQKILTPDIDVSVALVPNFSVFGITINIDDTYDQDPRLYPPYALRYDPDTVYNVAGKISPYNPIFITEFFLTPAVGIFDPSIGSFDITATAVYTYNGVHYPRNVTNLTTFTSENPSVIVMISNTAFIVGTGNAEVEGVFVAQKEWFAHGFYGIQTTHWDLGFSTLGTNTTLG